MSFHHTIQKRFMSLIFIFSLLAASGLIFGFASGMALGAGTEPGSYDANTNPSTSVQAQDSTSPQVACTGGPVIDGITLDECFDQAFVVGGANKSVRVWYSKNISSVQRVEEGVTYTLTHYINSDNEAQNVAQWAEEAWQVYWLVFGHHPYDNGCGDRISIQIEDLTKGSGVAYWAASGDCTIGIDAPVVRNGGGHGTTYHEVQHYLEYSYDNGCYDAIYDGYDGNAEFVEGYADLAEDSVDPALDLTLYQDFVHNYDPETSFFDKGYNDVAITYLVEQLGSLYAVSDPYWHWDAVQAHYQECDSQDSLYVLDDLIPTLRPGLTDEGLFLNFFAANWAKDWADHTAQPELAYFDDDAGPDYGDINLWKDVNLSSGTQSWAGENTPDDWAARYYQVRLQAGCTYVTAQVNGEAGAHLGINLMAADTTAPTAVNRTGMIGESMARTFRGFGTYDRLAAVVNAFDDTASYDVSFTCVTPVLDIKEPRQDNIALVGDPASPIAFLARFQVLSNNSPVIGLTEASFTAQAEGDPVTFVPGSFSQVGDEYWAVMLPPIKPAGTTFVDLEICFDGSICDSETDALDYVEPGNTDFALVFDGSNSMNDEDVAGEGTRVENARKAGTVLADLLRLGDRILVTSFSAIDDPPGCGGDDHNCPLDIITHLVRRDVTSLVNDIADTKAAISAITGRAWTPIGAALQDAKNQLLAGMGNHNPDHIILLSDGEENVNPMYASVKDELVASGVIIDTIRFGDVDVSGLTAQIAADTGGRYTFVPTEPGTLINLEQSRTQLADQLTQMGVRTEWINRLTAVTLPGPLGLDNVYDYYETIGQGAARLLHENYTGLAYDAWTTPSQIYVDESVNILRIVAASKQADYDEYCEGDKRDVEIAMPAERPTWIPVSPPNASTPSSWEIRHSLYDDVIIIPNPVPGTWQVRSRLWWQVCAGEQAPAGGAPQQADFDVMINSSAETNIQLVGRFLPPIEGNKGNAGQYVPIVATLLNRSGAIPGAEFCLLWWCWQGTIPVVIEKPGGTSELLLLRDDGLHNDGAAGDGVYGELYRTTNFAGTYNVRMIAFLRDPANTEKFISREWNGSFYLFGPPATNDGDADGMPDDWEQRCGLDTSSNDAGGDKDQDGLLNIDEFNRGTLPCKADTDAGGERDGSEVNNGRNPLDPSDDLVRPLGHITIEPVNAGIHIEWTHALSYTNMIAWVSTVEGQLGSLVNMGTAGVFTIPGVENGQHYYVVVSGENGTAGGEYSHPVGVTPKADPDAPSGGVLINNGALQTLSKMVTLNIGATDTPTGILPDSVNEISGNIQMRISNEANMAGATWESLATEKDWNLAYGPAGVYYVFVQFRDGAGNESSIVSDSIEYVAPNIFYLPVINK